MTENGDTSDRSREVDQIIRREGISSPKLKEIGRDHSGAGRGAGPHGETNQGRGVPGGGQGEQEFPGNGGSETDPDAPEDALPWRERHEPI